MQSKPHQRIRNRGIVPLHVEAKTANMTVAIAGVGGVGGLTAVMLVRQLKLKSLKLGDFDVFDYSNLNRQHGARHSTIGKSKLGEVAAECRDIDPELEVLEYHEGITPQNLEQFLDGADLLLNAVDYTKPEVFLALTRRAAERKIPVIVGAEVAYGARVVWFKPGSMSYGEYFGLKEGQELDLSRLIMRIPGYGDLRALKAVLAKTIPAPAIATGGLITAGLLVTWIEGILSSFKPPKPAPYAFYFDAKEGKGGYIRFPRLSFYLTLFGMLIRYWLGRNPASIDAASLQSDS